MTPTATAPAALALAPQPLAELSAVVPVHDEAENVAGVVFALCTVLPEVARRWEVIVVDDGSRDGTDAVLAELATGAPALRVVRHARNRGYGAALRSGFAAARHDWIFLVDGDGQVDPQQLADAVGALADHDGVIGYRTARADVLGRRLATRLWNGLVRRLFGLRTRDVNCAFKLLPAALVRDEPLVSDGAVISAEMLVRAAQSDHRLAEVPVVYRPRLAGRASGAQPRVVARAGMEIVRLYLQARRRERA